MKLFRKYSKLNQPVMLSLSKHLYRFDKLSMTG